MDNKIDPKVSSRILKYIKNSAKVIEDNKLTSILFAVFLLNISISAFLRIFTGDYLTAAKYGLAFLTKYPPLDDSWGPMYKALMHLRMFPHTPVYSTLFFADHVKFQYPISSLVFLDILQRITGASEQALYSIMNTVSWGSVFLTGFVSWLIYKKSLEDSRGAKSNSKPAGLVSLAVVMAITVIFYPLIASYLLGQIQTMLTLFVALTLLYWQREKPGLAGLFLGIACAIKPQWTVILLWGVMRKEWKFVLAGGFTFGVLTLASVGMYGLPQYFDYLPVLSFLSQRGESYYPNQSVNGLFHRILFNGNNLQWLENGFPPFNPLVYVVTLVTSALILTAALLWKRKHKAGAFDLALLILSLTMASPIAWDHHYAILLPMFALIVPVGVSNKVMGKYTNLYLLIAFLLTSQRFNAANLLADTRLNFLQSTIFFGAVMILVLLYKITSTKTPDEQIPTATSAN